MACESLILPVIPPVPDPIPPYNATALASLYGELTALIKADLDEQLTLGRIKGTEYANVYSILMKDAMQLAFSGQLEAQKIAAGLYATYTAQADAYYKQAQVELTCRQTEGFDDDLNKKMIEIQMNAWSVMFSSGLLHEVPSIITSDELSKLYYGLISEVNQEYSFISGPEKVVAGVQQTYTISNYDISNTYTVETNLGTVSTLINNSFTFYDDGSASGKATLTLRAVDTDGLLEITTKNISWK